VIIDAPRIGLHGTACKYRPHITLFPRFQGVLRSAIVGFAARRVVSLVRRLPVGIQLVGPVRIGPRLLWYECVQGCDGFVALIDFHSRMVTAARGLQTSSEFSFGNFRPHLTARSDSRPVDEFLPPQLRVWPSELALYSYSGDPCCAPVKRTVLVRLPHLPFSRHTKVLLHPRSSAPFR
jgi:hypothetical protein